MADTAISTYTQKATPVNADLILGTDSAASNATKNFPISGIAAKANAAAAHVGVSTFDDDLVVDTDTFVVDVSSERVGVNVLVPQSKLHVDGAGGETVTRYTNTSTGATSADGLKVGIQSDGTGQIMHLEAEALLLGTSGTEQMRIDSDGNVGIGTNAPNGLLEVSDTSGAAVILQVTSNTSSSARINFGDTVDAGAGSILYANSNDSMRFITATSEAFRVDSDGNVGIGNTAPNAKLHISSSSPDIILQDDDLTDTYAKLSAASGNLFIESDPDNVRAGSVMGFKVDGSEAMRIDSSGNVIAGGDNVATLGGASNRWSEVFAGNATINTSDAREKTEVSIEDKVLDAVDSISIKGFKWNSAIELKGDGARIHFGVFAQEIKAAFEGQGLVAEEYSLLCYDEWDDRFETVEVTPAVPAVLDEEGEVVTEAIPAVTEEKLTMPAGNRYGVRYEELMALKVACLERKMEALEAANA